MALKTNKRLMACLIFLILFGSLSAQEIIASKTTGVAPLAVHFDAVSLLNKPANITATNYSNYFSEGYFEWDFDDVNSGNWSTTFKSKNKAFGPIASHLFENPGQYIVSLKHTKLNGSIITKTVTINVQDPNIVFSGTNTICLSNSNNFTGAPAGAEKINTTTLATISNHLKSGKRVLLRKGESWNFGGTIGLSNMTGPGILGTFGSGAHPTISVGSSASQVFSISNLSDWKIIGLKIVGNSSGDTIGIKAEQHVSEFLLLDCQFKNLGSNGILLHESIINYYHGNQSPQKMYKNIFCYNNIADGCKGNMFYLSTNNLVMQGNQFLNAGAHVTRHGYLYKAILSNNFYDGTYYDAPLHTIKLHAPDISDSTVNEQNNYSSEVIISDNIITGRSAWPVAIGPQDGGKNEQIHNILIERNLFNNEPPVQHSLRLWAKMAMVRNNIFDMSNNKDYLTAISISTRGIEGPPIGCKVYNNTVFKKDSGSIDFISTSQADTKVKNNVLHASNGSMNCSGSNCVPNYIGDPMMSFDSNGTPNINENSPVIDKSQEATAMYDFNGNTRVGVVDMGAVEFINNSGEPINQNPIASFIVATNIGPAPVVVTFDSSDSQDPDGNITAYEWDFGDSTTGLGVIAHNDYAAAGNYTVALKVTDNDGAINVTQKSITILSAPVVNQPPSGQSDSVITDENQSILIDVLENDSDPENDPLSIASFTTAMNGTVAIENNKLLYSPAQGFIGNDNFTYIINDGQSNSESIQVFIKIEPVSILEPGIISSEDFTSGQKNGGTGWSGAWEFTSNVAIANTNWTGKGPYHMIIGKDGEAKRDVDLNNWKDIEISFDTLFNQAKTGDQCSLLISDGSSEIELLKLNAVFYNYLNFRVQIPSNMNGKKITLIFRTALNNNWAKIKIDNIVVNGVENFQTPQTLPEDDFNLGSKNGGSGWASEWVFTNQAAIKETFWSNNQPFNLQLKGISEARRSIKIVGHEKVKLSFFTLFNRGTNQDVSQVLLSDGNEETLLYEISPFKYNYTQEVIEVPPSMLNKKVDLIIRSNILSSSGAVHYDNFVFSPSK